VWATRTAWVLLWLTTLALISLAVYLLFRMDLFAGGSLPEEGMKALWAFLGVALGAVATIIGTLLTDQASRRSEAIARETEDRLVLDTRARVMELITHEGDYAPPARVAGALATMMELRGGAVASRVLRDLWASDKVGTASAVWMLDRILADENSSDADKAAATDALTANVARLFPRPDDPVQDWHAWPEIVMDNWPGHLPTRVKSDLLILCIKAMLVRPPEYWKDVGDPLPRITMEKAVRKGAVDPDYGPLAALALVRVMDAMEMHYVEEGEMDRLRSLASDEEAAPWFLKLLEQFEPWGRGEALPSGPWSVVRDPSPLSSQAEGQGVVELAPQDRDQTSGGPSGDAPSAEDRAG
jgi:hypothetical protein